MSRTTSRRKKRWPHDSGGRNNCYPAGRRGKSSGNVGRVILGAQREAGMNEAGTVPRLGEGRISGGISVAIGLLSVGAVLCLRFPGWLTTPELRAHYNLELLRLVLALAMGAGVCLALISFCLNRRKHMGAAGRSAILRALLLGGPYVPLAQYEPSAPYLGLDWLVLDLFFTGAAFIALERLFPRVIAGQRVLRQGWRLDLVYFSVNHLLIGAFLLASTHFAHDAFGWA